MFVFLFLGLVLARDLISTKFTNPQFIFFSTLFYFYF